MPRGTAHRRSGSHARQRRRTPHTVVSVSCCHSCKVRPAALWTRGQGSRLVKLDALLREKLLEPRALFQRIVQLLCIVVSRRRSASGTYLSGQNRNMRSSPQRLPSSIGSPILRSAAFVSSSARGVERCRRVSARQMRSMPTGQDRRAAQPQCRAVQCSLGFSVSASVRVCDAQHGVQ